MPPSPLLVRDLLDLPAQVNKGDFVQTLDASLRDPEATVRTYTVTPSLARNFQDCLRVISGALSTRRSQPVFLEGSFGSGKSHFMAILHLVLQGHPAPWRKTEMHEVRPPYEPLAGKRLLQLHFHMLGATSFETAIFRGYVDHVRQHHPDAPLPALFRDQEVFDNARALREVMGDDAFFRALNRGQQPVAGFGRLAASLLWSAPRFEDAVRSPDGAVRRSLFDDLVRTLLPAFIGQSDPFVDADEGLGEMSRHAASLGYEAILLYMDETILWLASLPTRDGKLQREVVKLVKLKEARDEARVIPIVAFMAQQRDLGDLVDADGTGSERALVEETFGHHRSRFHTVKLEDSNLRAIIPHRVVVPRTDDDAARLEDGFAEMWAGAARALSTLQGGNAAKADFQQVYPFSPALVEALVFLADRLQRERTAIRILVEMLVEHLPDLKLGEVVPVGDVFDLVVSAEDAVDSPNRARFQRVRELYLHHLLPRIQARNDTTTPVRCQRLRPGHPLRIGCSGCGLLDCRRDNRLVKTALLAALVPQAPAFAGLTVKRLVHLNHGAIKAPVETIQVNLAATALRDISRDVDALKVEGPGDPVVKVDLQTVDTRKILDKAADQDTPQRRRTLLRQILFTQLGLPGARAVETHTVDYHHTRRSGVVSFGNVRTLRADDFECTGDAEWKVVVDYPFDEPGYSPHDDERQVEAIREELPRPTTTLVWLPTFFSQQVMDQLGQLARLEHILDESQIRTFLADIPPDDHIQARTDLGSRRDRCRRDVLEALRKAYGLATPDERDSMLDLDRQAREHVLTLHDAIDPRTPRGAGMEDGLRDLATQILDARYPRHPPFQAAATAGRVDKVRRCLEDLAEAGGGMKPVERTDRDDLSAIAEPLRLCRVHTQQVELLDTVFEQIESARARAGEDEPTAAQVFEWADPQGLAGYQPPVRSLVVWPWAARSRRVAHSGGRPVTWPSNARLEDYVTFRKPDLPGETDFDQAIQRSAIFGVPRGNRALNARNVADLVARLRAVAESGAAREAGRIPALLAARGEPLGARIPTPRYTTAETLVRLLVALQTPADRALIEAFAGVSIVGTSIQALARAWHRASDLAQALDGQGWTVIDLLRERQDEERIRERARALLDRLRQLLVDDEIHAHLPETLREIVEEASRLLRRPRTGWRQIWAGHRPEVPGADALRVLDGLRADLAEEIRRAGDLEVRVTLDLSLEKRVQEDES